MVEALMIPFGNGLSVGRKLAYGVYNHFAASILP